MRFGPRLRRDVLDLPVDHRGQPGEDIAQVVEGIEAAPPAGLNHRVDDRAAFAGIGLADEKPVLLVMLN